MRFAIALATAPTADRGNGVWYGLGWAVDRDGVYSHAGSDGTYAWVDPERELFGIILTQSPGGKNLMHHFQQLVARAADATRR